MTSLPISLQPQRVQLSSNSVTHIADRASHFLQNHAKTQEPLSQDDIAEANRYFRTEVVLNANFPKAQKFLNRFMTLSYQKKGIPLDKISLKGIEDHNLFWVVRSCKYAFDPLLSKEFLDSVLKVDRLANASSGFQRLFQETLGYCTYHAQERVAFVCEELQELVDQESPSASSAVKILQSLQIPRSEKAILSSFLSIFNSFSPLNKDLIELAQIDLLNALKNRLTDPWHTSCVFNVFLSCRALHPELKLTNKILDELKSSSASIYIKRLANHPAGGLLKASFLDAMISDETLSQSSLLFKELARYCFSHQCDRMETIEKILNGSPPTLESNDLLCFLIDLKKQAPLSDQIQKAVEEPNEENLKALIAPFVDFAQRIDQPISLKNLAKGLFLGFARRSPDKEISTLRKTIYPTLIQLFPLKVLSDKEFLSDLEKDSANAFHYSEHLCQILTHATSSINSLANQNPSQWELQKNIFELCGKSKLIRAYRVNTLESTNFLEAAHLLETYPLEGRADLDLFFKAFQKLNTFEDPFFPCFMEQAIQSTQTSALPIAEKQEGLKILFSTILKWVQESGMPHKECSIWIGKLFIPNRHYWNAKLMEILLPILLKNNLIFDWIKNREDFPIPKEMLAFEKHLPHWVQHQSIPFLSQVFQIIEAGCEDPEKFWRLLPQELQESVQKAMLS